jgi:hypothetical protein
MSQAMLPEFDQEMRNTRKALERVPDGKFDWKPHAKSMSLGQLAEHIAELPAFSAAILATECLDFDKGDYKVLALFDKNIATARQAIAAATDDHLKKSWHMV